MTKVQSVIREKLCENVTTRKVKDGTMTLWDIQVEGDTKLTTFQSPLGEKARGYIGQVCDFQITIETTDKGYTNLYLDGVQRSPNVTQPSPVAQAAAAAQAAAQTGPVVSYDQYKDLSQGQEQRRTESIHRQTAAKVAAAMLPETPQEFWSNVNDLVSFFASGTNPYLSSATVPEQGGTSPTPSDDTPHNPDDDIPF